MHRTAKSTDIWRTKNEKEEAKSGTTPITTAKPWTQPFWTTQCTVLPWGRASTCQRRSGTARSLVHRANHTSCPTKPQDPICLLDSSFEDQANTQCCKVSQQNRKMSNLCMTDSIIMECLIIAAASMSAIFTVPCPDKLHQQFKALFGS